MTTASIDAEFRAVSIPRCRPTLMVGCYVASDIFCLALSGMLAILLKLAPDHLASFRSYLSLVPLLLVFPAVYAGMGLYSGISVGSPEELRRMTLSSAVISLFLGVLTVSFRGTNVLFTWAMALSLAFSIVLVPLARLVIRIKMGNASWWGYPTIVFGEESNIRKILLNLLANPGLGLKPIGFHSIAENSEDSIEGVPPMTHTQLVSWASNRQGPAYAISLSPTELERSTIEIYRPYFSYILMFPRFFGLSCLGVNPKNLGGMLGLEIRQQVFVPSRVILKRSMDLLFSFTLITLLAPLMAVIAIAVAFDSPGPIFYGQRRIGRGGREFRAWKFRSMAANADHVLSAYLAKYPDLQEEWSRNHKLKHDPRVSRIGQFLRKTSLDELPQLWNVLVGQMSLVGPRPIVREEIARYGTEFETYMYVHSGLTGLWQVSGRSDTSYQQRIAFDRFYVDNWSVWLDICILFRTIGVVLNRSGAV